ncbi:MAG: 50S ribosomal protein L13 [Nitrososphaeria archaeon]
MSSEVIYLDGKGLIMGRLASLVAKMLLEGKSVYVFNTEQIVISGNKRSIIEQWKKKLEIQSRINPKHTPPHYRRPDRIFRRVVRGMLPRDKPKGIVAFKNLKVYHGVPEEFKDLKLLKMDKATAKGFETDYIKLVDLSKELGWSIENAS